MAPGELHGQASLAHAAQTMNGVRHRGDRHRLALADLHEFVVAPLEETSQGMEGKIAWRSLLSAEQFGLPFGQDTRVVLESLAEFAPAIDHHSKADLAGEQIRYRLGFGVSGSRSRDHEGFERRMEILG